MANVVRAVPPLSFCCHFGGALSAFAAFLRSLRARRRVSRPVATTKAMTKARVPSTMSTTGLSVCFAVEVPEDEPLSEKTINSPSVMLVINAPSR